MCQHNVVLPAHGNRHVAPNRVHRGQVGALEVAREESSGPKLVVQRGIHGEIHPDLTRDVQRLLVARISVEHQVGGPLILQNVRPVEDGDRAVVHQRGTYALAPARRTCHEVAFNETRCYLHIRLREEAVQRDIRPAPGSPHVGQR